MPVYEDYTVAVEMTDEQKFVFDLKGWIAIPAVLNEEEIEVIKAHIYTLREGADSLDPKDRYPLSGPAQILLDHPVAAGVLREIMGADTSADCYGFRCEGSFYTIRGIGDGGLDPHGGAGIGPISYSARDSRMFSGLTRIVWELNEVHEDDGGTLFLSGSHKMNFPLPDIHKGQDSPLLETYCCPPGTMLVFTESTIHAGQPWKNPDRERAAIFTAYNHHMSQYHKMNLPAEVVESMPPKRQTLFRGVWHHDFENAQPNDYYSPDNRSL